MAVRMPLKWVLMGLLVGTAVVSAVSAEPLTNCDWLTPGDPDCIQEIECQDYSTVLRVWEDCPLDSELFTITNDSLSLEADCKFASETTKVIRLTTLLDAEDEESKTEFCTLLGGYPDAIYFNPQDINEYHPYPSADTDPVMEVNCMENMPPPVEIATIYYSDDDFGETSTLTSELISTEYKDIFTLEELAVDEDNNWKSFSFKTNEELDFEDRAFYKMEYRIVSIDGKNNTKTTDHTFFVYVGDRPDNPPFWTQIQPLYELDECQVEDDLFNVTAQDRDVMVDYDIRYFLNETEESYRFEIDNITGMVSKKGKIDREELLDLGISSLSLVITATEYDITSGLDGEHPNSNEQVTIVTMVDCNDEKPEFNQSTFILPVMEELTTSSSSRELLVLVVKDMDEGDGGKFDLTTNYPDQVKISPEQGQQTQSVRLTAIYNGSLFDYEVQGNTSFDIEITATEVQNASHASTATVTITLSDVNDEEPFFIYESYSKSVDEGIPEDTFILQVEADDNDVSPEFGKPSIRYSLDSTCNALHIDSESGNVTLVATLNYEDTTSSNPITCTVTARDNYGTDYLEGKATIVVTILDVVDEPPQFETSGELEQIMENSNEGSLVDTIIVTDADAEASISFEIVESSCLSDNSANVTGWFTVSDGTPDPPNFPGLVEVGSQKIDRELCSKVELNIQAKDSNTAEEYVSTDAETFTITILDENDEPPTVDCEESCTGINVNEDDELNPSDVEVLVFRVKVTDPDEKDTIQLSLSKGGEYFYLLEEEVSLEEEDVKFVDVKTIKEAIIDREELDTIDIEIIAMDSQNQTTPLEVTVAVNDLNDKKPVININTCSPHIKIPEDDGNGDQNGTSVFTISATDDDKEYPFNYVTYVLLNDQFTDSKNRWMPFTINETTGNVTILLKDGEKALDREQFPNWELVFRAYDNCGGSLTCKVLTSDVDCHVNITVLDVNDHAPRDLSWLPDEQPMTVTDFQKENEILKYVISAIDDDEGEYASLTYEVLGTYREGSDVDMKLFRAEEDVGTVSSCRLISNEDFQGKNYTGNYIIILQAKDGGNLTTNFNISMQIEDANDEPPLFILEGCLHESEPNVITMEENAYQPGPEGMEVMCYGPDQKEEFIIDYEDADYKQENRLVTVEIDKENSTIKGTSNVSEQTLLSYWSLEPDTCRDPRGGCRLVIDHPINYEEGSVYNLVLKIQNTAEPHLESRTTVRVVVSNECEYDPYFCATTNCSETVLMYENEKDASAVFTDATDEDNNNVDDSDDDMCTTIYYYIVGGDEDYFELTGETETKIVLKDKPDGLDREEKDEYSLTILATNDVGGFDIGGNPRNDTLTLIIKVGDDNDEFPSFIDDVLFTSFMESNSPGDSLTTIEAIDLDLNDSLKYEIQDDVEWFETSTAFNPENPFSLQTVNERSVDLKLNFDPKGMTGGYCNFTLTVEDEAGHVDETVVKVYVITEDYQVAMYFSNEKEEIQSQKNQVESIYSDVYGYQCTIDSISETLSSDGTKLPNRTTVYMHFIDEEKNEPVDDKIILDLSDNAETMVQLMNRLSLIGVKLDSIDAPKADDEKSPDQTIRELQILLGVVSLVLGLLVLLLATTYWLRTNKLQRKIKVLSTNTFGSKDEGLNQMGLDVMSVPGSNYLAKEHGNHNPVFSEGGGSEFKHQDAESISSGDSVLVGVEDNPEFKGYLAKNTPASSSKGLENPSYGRSIDDVSAAPPGVHGGVKGNPLLNLGGLKGDFEPSVPSNESVYDGDSMGSNDDASVDQNINSNFTFS